MELVFSLVKVALYFKSSATLNAWQRELSSLSGKYSAHSPRGFVREKKLQFAHFGDKEKRRKLEKLFSSRPAAKLAFSSFDRSNSPSFQDD